ncbi:MAG TPA: bifunctional histidinol-phosphatase/imidazoleglycerol-phosphate dehydratase HisB [Flavobacteriales bacterium]|jgi:imidazoleglycerol-phosphate dehydratase/histidinol-phosphatase
MRKKLLLIDRDGTIIKEPPITFQVDELSQLELLPGVIRNLYKICSTTDYEIVMVTNQDGLGTESYPQDKFDAVQKMLLNILENEGIKFADIHIDKSFEHENLPTRKPGIGMLTKYLNGDYDLENSYVIGDRPTDIQLAKNLGAKSIFIHNGNHQHSSNDTLIVSSWDEIYELLCHSSRAIVHKRNTKETQIKIELNPDGTGKSSISTGLAFFDHMLEQLARHGQLDLTIETKGDLHIDEHHTIEDTAIALGEAFALALKDKRGMERYGFTLPMDDCLAQVAIDFGGRNWIVWDAEFKREKIGDVPTEMFYHFFKSFSDAAKCNLNIKVEGTNEHHKIESIFKAFAKAIRMAVKRDVNNMQLPSTKGVL